MATKQINFQSFVKHLASDVVDFLNGDSDLQPIINYDFTYGVNRQLKNKGFTDYSLIVYHGAPSPSPHYTLNTHTERRVNSEIIDISEKQAVALNMGLLTVWDLRLHRVNPKQNPLFSDEELAELILNGKG